MVVDPVGQRAGRLPHRGDPLRGARFGQYVVRVPAAMGVQAAVSQQFQPRTVRGEAAGPGGEQVAATVGATPSIIVAVRVPRWGGEVLAAPPSSAAVRNRATGPAPSGSPRRDQQAVTGACT